MECINRHRRRSLRFQTSHHRRLRFLCLHQVGTSCVDSGASVFFVYLRLVQYIHRWQKRTQLSAGKPTQWEASSVHLISCRIRMKTARPLQALMIFLLLLFFVILKSHYLQYLLCLCIQGRLQLAIKIQQNRMLINFKLFFFSITSLAVIQ